MDEEFSSPEQKKRDEAVQTRPESFYLYSSTTPSKDSSVKPETPQF